MKGMQCTGSHRGNSQKLTLSAEAWRQEASVKISSLHSGCQGVCPYGRKGLLKVNSDCQFLSFIQNVLGLTILYFYVSLPFISIFLFLDPSTHTVHPHTHRGRERGTETERHTHRERGTEIERQNKRERETETERERETESGQACADRTQEL